MSAGDGIVRGESVSYKDQLAVPGSGLADPHDCLGCTLLKEQLSEVLQTQRNLALWELLRNITTPKEYGQPDDARPPH
ncbi:hypothetical protein AB0D04_10205 [Streptomyces sp. NPDC048483]|uniref:hypothetical protein n=1 Tax=Streptomyces sp. NPDC048483 TaxID=3154927 RepID=UPI003423DAA5